MRFFITCFLAGCMLVGMFVASRADEPRLPTPEQYCAQQAAANATATQQLLGKIAELQAQIDKRKAEDATAAKPKE